MTSLAVIDNHANVEAYRASTNAAELCKEIVVATASNIQGRRYVAVEGWMAIAVAHGCSASARDVERVEGGVRAIGEVRRMSDGQLIATAEGFVGEDEPTWFGGESVTRYGKKTLPKRPDYAIRAMAQTRAISRACRTAFAHVVVLMNAGLATTPAEEVPFEGFDPETGEVPRSGPAPRTKLEGPHTSKTALRNAVCDIIAKVRAAQSVDEIDALKAENKRTINQALRDWPELIDGEPGLEEDVGLKGVIEQRRAELSGEDGMVAVLLQSMKAADTKAQFDQWRENNLPVIETLDGADRRKVEQAMDWHESAILEMDKVTGGA